MFRSLGPENLLLKGATLKNTKKIYGEHFFYHSSDEHLHMSLSLYLERENTCSLSTRVLQLHLYASCLKSFQGKIWRCWFYLQCCHAMQVVLIHLSKLFFVPELQRKGTYFQILCQTLLLESQSQTSVIQNEGWQGRLIFFLTVCDPWAAGQCSGICAINITQLSAESTELSAAEQPLGNADFLNWESGSHVHADASDGSVKAGSLLACESLMSSALILCRCGSLYWYGNKNGFELPREISETLCCRKVSIYSRQKLV